MRRVGLLVFAALALFILLLDATNDVVSGSAAVVGSALLIGGYLLYRGR